MAQVQREFQVFVKPAGSTCNMACRYCYYSGKSSHDKEEPVAMSDDILEEYILQHIDASSNPEVRFSWHGGEPTVLGLDYFRNIIALQRKHCRPDRTITNGIQTNGTLLNEEWCRFLADEHFSVGISLDGTADLHDQNRLSKRGLPSHEGVMEGYRLLQQYNIPCDILCAVHAGNVRNPLEVYRFFRKIGARYIGFLPVVERGYSDRGTSDLTVSAEGFGDFLCAIFDKWQNKDIGIIRVQVFEEALAMALGQDHALCIFRRTCGDIPVVESNGDFFSCDHFVDNEHRIGNILQTPLSEMLESPKQRKFGQIKLDRLPRYCKQCEVLPMCNGGCPKDRLLLTPDGEEGLNYLCAGYKRFFTHIIPFATQVRALTEIASSARESMGQDTSSKVKTSTVAKTEHVAKIGRNNPCPCGSGLKYKKCCMGK